MATQGRCKPCNVRVVFNKQQKMAEVVCPICYRKLSRTTHNFSTGDIIFLAHDGSIQSINRHK